MSKQEFASQSSNWSHGPRLGLLLLLLLLSWIRIQENFVSPTVTPTITTRCHPFLVRWLQWILRQNGLVGQEGQTDTEKPHQAQESQQGTSRRRIARASKATPPAL